MKAILVRSAGEISIIDIDAPVWKSLQEYVGGFWEICRPLGLPFPYLMICNESGLLERLPVNHAACFLYGTQIHGHPIVGDVVILCEHGDDLTGIPEERLEYLKDWLGSIRNWVSVS